MRTDYPATWFRLYAEFATDPKVQMLSEADQRRFIMLLCMRCSNGDVTLHDEEVAFQLRVTDTEWGETKRRLITKNLIDDDNKPMAWEKRQRASDTSAERVAKHRAAKKQACNAAVTLQQRQVETETETENKDQKNKTPRDKRASPSARVEIKSEKMVESGVSSPAASEYLSYRRAKKAPLTPMAWKRIVSEIHKTGMSIDDALGHAMARGWQGFDAEWLREKNRAGPINGETAGDRRSRERNEFWEQINGNGNRGAVQPAIDGQAVRVD